MKKTQKKIVTRDFVILLGTVRNDIVALLEPK